MASLKQDISTMKTNEIRGAELNGAESDLSQSRLK